MVKTFGRRRVNAAATSPGPASTGRQHRRSGCPGGAGSRTSGPDRGARTVTSALGPVRRERDGRPGLRPADPRAVRPARPAGEGVERL
nr:hypothetical protein [Angustibacter aerolatus]